MYNGKFNSKHTKRRLRWNKQFVLLVSILALVVGVAGGSLAYLIANTNSVVNTFTPGEVKIEINEPNENGVKKNVTITNSGNASAYIRAMIVVTWQDAAGNVYAKQPVAGTDYTIALGTTGWTGAGNGYYVTTQAVGPGETTPVLIESCSPVDGKAPAGYHLVVDVIAEAKQANPDGSMKPWKGGKE